MPRSHMLQCPGSRVRYLSSDVVGHQPKLTCHPSLRPQVPEHVRTRSTTGAQCTKSIRARRCTARIVSSKATATRIAEFARPNARLPLSRMRRPMTATVSAPRSRRLPRRRPPRRECQHLVRPPLRQRVSREILRGTTTWEFRRPRPSRAMTQFRP